MGIFNNKFPDEEEDQKQSSQGTAKFDRPRGGGRFKGPRFKTGPGTVRGKAPVGAPSASADFRRVMNGQTPIAPTPGSTRMRRLLEAYSPRAYEHPNRKKERGE